MGVEVMREVIVTQLLELKGTELQYVVVIIVSTTAVYLHNYSP